jgi:putative NIF3 family GTP cyclohydrolase 1 type 2
VHTNYGAGAMGEINHTMNKVEFLDYASQCLKIKNFRYTNGNGNKIKTIALCGGSGSDFIPDAINQGADTYITADIKYHTFLDTEDKLLLIDAGHFETEIFLLNELNRRLNSLIKENKIRVFKYSKNANPINFYNNSGA